MPSFVKIEVQRSSRQHDDLNGVYRPKPRRGRRNLEFSIEATLPHGGLQTGHLTGPTHFVTTASWLDTQTKLSYLTSAGHLCPDVHAPILDPTYGSRNSAGPLCDLARN